MAAHSDLLRKFTDLAFDEAAEARWQESRPPAVTPALKPQPERLASPGGQQPMRNMRSCGPDSPPYA